jgi:hypothetical protein
MKKSGKLSFSEMYGRIPVPKKANMIMQPKKGKGSYKRKQKNYNNSHSFGSDFFILGVI